MIKTEYKTSILFFLLKLIDGPAAVQTIVDPC